MSIRRARHTFQVVAKTDQKVMDLLVEIRDMLRGLLNPITEEEEAILKAHAESGKNEAGS